MVGLQALMFSSVRLNGVSQAGNGNDDENDSGSNPAS